MVGKKIAIWLMLSLLVGVTLCGCKKSSVSQQGTAPFSLTVDWSNIKEGATVPQSATVYLYPILGPDTYGEPIIFSASALTKANVTLAEGVYRMIAHNNDLDKIKLRNSTVCKEFEGYVEPIAKTSVFSRAADEIVPEVEFLHLLTGTSSKEIVVAKDVPLDLTIRPRTATNTYRFNLIIDSPRRYTSASAVLSGVATSINIFTAVVQPVNISNVSVPLTMKINEQGKSLAQGQVEVLGVDPSNRNPGSNKLHMTLDPVQTDPQKPLPSEEFTVDLTEELDKYDNASLDINLEIKPDPSGSGLVLILISVKPWQVLPSIDLDVIPAE